LSYCGLVDAKIRASDNHLPVGIPKGPVSVKKDQKKPNGARKYQKQQKSSQNGITKHFIKNYEKLLKFEKCQKSSKSAGSFAVR
jgi:hypothetical protein